MKKHLLLCLMIGIALCANAQQNTSFREGNIASPTVHQDGSVTFQLLAPKAKHVQVIGDWEVNGGQAKMKKGKGGVWEYTTPVLPSEMYTYRFDIDGVISLDPTNPFTKRDVGNQFSIFYVDGDPARYYQVQNVAHGTLETTWYKSEAAKMDRRVSIYLPPMYNETNTKFPVLYLLHGSGGDETAWVELGNVVRIMDNLIAAEKVRPMIVVMPNGNFSQPAAPGETPDNLAFRPVMSHLIPGNYKNGLYESCFDEIVTFIDKNYRTIPDKKHRAVAGLSMGGFHTLFIALNHPNMFNYIGLFSAGLLNRNQMEEAPEAYLNMEDKLRTLHDFGYDLFWIAIGQEDFLYEINADFRKQLDELQIPYKYKESTRGHLWSNWRQYLLEFSQMLFK